MYIVRESESKHALLGTACTILNLSDLLDLQMNYFSYLNIIEIVECTK